jgi:hypothetical protein
MVDLKNFSTSGVTISGIELTEKIREGQFKIGKPCGSKATIPEILASPAGCVTRDNYK